jgi:DNA-binding GntR family transcriptional regulator
METVTAPAASEDPSVSAGAVSPLSLSEVAYRALLDMLLNGELRPSEVVTERQIAARLGISRTPLREAVRRLEGERTLERQRGGALVVRPMPTEEFINILSARRLLEGETARLAAGRIPRSVIASMQARIIAVRDCPTGSNPTDIRDSDHDLHAMIAAASGNPVLETMIADLRKRTELFRTGRLPIDRQNVYEEHLEILDALAAPDPERARERMQAHIDQVRLFLIEKLSAY